MAAFGHGDGPHGTSWREGVLWLPDEQAEALLAVPGASAYFIGGGVLYTLDGEDAGEMRSALDGQGLALLRLDAVERADREGLRLTAGGAALTVSILLTGLALFGVGAAVSLLTGRSALYSGARQLGIGAAAAAITYLVGSLIGVNV